jgi:hypothetical protein
MVRKRGQRSGVRSRILFLSLFTSFLLLSGGGACFSQAITARASTDKTQYLIGDYINYTITVDCPKGSKIYPPALTPDSLPNLSIIKKENPEEEEKNDSARVIFKYVLSCYDSAGVTIPPIAVPYQVSEDSTARFAHTNSVSFAVQTLKVNPQAEIMDVKPPMKISLDWKMVVLWLLVALVVIGILSYYFLLKKKRKVKSLPPERILPPHLVALNALHDLEQQKLWQKGMIKEYHSAITEIVRRYFEKRFEMPAMELPTSEAVELLGRNRESESILGTTYDFLSNADLVKFAKFTPLDSVNEEMMKQAYEIVNKTIPVTQESADTLERPGQEAIAGSN